MTDRSVSIQEHPVSEKLDKRIAIMRAAERLFHNRRFHEVTLEEVAEAAQVGKGTIYRYFADKDDLFFQVAFTRRGTTVRIISARRGNKRERRIYEQQENN